MGVYFGSKAKKMMKQATTNKNKDKRKKKKHKTERKQKGQARSSDYQDEFSYFVVGPILLLLL